MTIPAAPIKFYSMRLSGNAHRVLLALRALSLPYELIEVDLRAREQKTEVFLGMNPFGQVPVIDDNGTVIWDSVGILSYLGLTYDDGTFLPRDPVLFAEVMVWLAKTSGPIAYGLAKARRIHIFNAQADLAGAQALGCDLLAVMEALLKEREWLVAKRATLADLATYAYIAHAPEGGVDLAPYGHVCAWLMRIEALPFFVAMPKTPAGLWA